MRSAHRLAALSPVEEYPATPAAFARSDPPTCPPGSSRPLPPPQWPGHRDSLSPPSDRGWSVSFSTFFQWSSASRSLVGSTSPHLPRTMTRPSAAASRACHSASVNGSPSSVASALKSRSALLCRDRTSNRSPHGLVLIPRNQRSDPVGSLFLSPQPLFPLDVQSGSALKRANSMNAPPLGLVIGEVAESRRPGGTLGPRWPRKWIAHSVALNCNLRADPEGMFAVDPVVLFAPSRSRTVRTRP